MVESFWAKKEKTFDFSKVFILVEVTGFEPATFWSRSNLPQVHFIHLVLGNTA